MAKTDFKIAHYDQNNKILSALRTRNHQVELQKDHINITYGILDQIFKALDEADILAKQIIPCLATLSKKVKILLWTLSENLTTLSKKKKLPQKTPNDLEKLHLDFSEEGKGEMSAGHVGVFWQNLGITAYTLENYSNFKNKYLFNNGIFLK